jgi:hypothetical protein
VQKQSAKTPLAARKMLPKTLLVPPTKQPKLRPRGTKKVAEETGRSSERAGKKSGEEVGKGAKDTGKGVDKAAKKTADALK